MKIIVLFFSFLTAVFCLQAQADICSRNPVLVAELQNILNMPCQNISGSDLETVQYLAIHHEAILDPQPSDFENLSNLTSLIFLFTTAKSLPPNLFRDLKSLQQLSIYSDYIGGTSSLPEQIFEGLPLKQLIIYIPTLTSLPSQIFHRLNYLKFISLTTSEDMPIPKGLFDGLTLLSSVSIISKTASVPEDLFQGLANLNHLSLSDLEFIPPRLFQNLSALKKVYFSGIGGATLPETLFQSSVQIEQVEIRASAFTYLPGGLFQGLSALDRVIITYNRQLLSFHEKLFSSLTQLKSLEIIFNGITTLPKSPFKDLSSLEYLSLSYNQLTNLDEDVFVGLSALHHVDLDHNSLKYLGKNIFRNPASSWLNVDLGYNFLCQDVIDEVTANASPNVHLNIYKQTCKP